MDLQLDGKVFLATGASAGIGAATVRTLAAEGATVVGIARSTEGIEALGARVSAVAADMTDPRAPERAVADVVIRHGRLDGLVNNVGGRHLITSTAGRRDRPASLARPKPSSVTG